MADTINQGKLTIEGIVTAADWDENDEISSIKILTDDEDEYFVVDDEIGQELFNYLHEEVEARGVCDDGSQGYKSFTVQEFFVLSEADNETGEGYEYQEIDPEDDEWLSEEMEGDEGGY